ncbi:MAG: aromatic ring-hydroxylating dioxygenase subunit alpha [Actinomycetota bacterium]
MNAHSRLVEMARRALEHADAGTQGQADDVLRIPAANYVDRDRWELEMARIFRRVPLVAGFSAEVAAPGSYKALERAGVPVLLSRGADGELRAFVNMCSHRGAIVAEPGHGTARRFACPYHAWTYNQSGELVGVPDRSDFGLEDTSCLGLTPLPVAERAGIVFVSVDPNATLDVDTFLCGYDEMLATARLDECTYVGEQHVAGPNWKIAYDGYLDLYHLPFLHKDSFGPGMNNKAIYEGWGPHQRVFSPNPKFDRYRDLPDEEWPLDVISRGLFTIFPHVSIAGFDVGEGLVFMISQLTPGDAPGESITTQSFLFRGELDDEHEMLIKKQMAFLESVVRDEDYATGLGIQKALATGTKPEVIFGRNEGGGQQFHGWVDRFVAAEDDAALAALFE